MRITAWAFVLCAVLGALGVFVPCLEVELGGAAVHKRTQVSLYTVSRDRDQVRALFATYHRSKVTRIGGKLIRAAAPRAGGRARAALGDARDALDTLDDVSDDDVHTAGIALVATLGTLLGLELVMTALVFGALMRGLYRRGRLIVTLLAALVVALLGVALHVGCRVAVWEANDEVGREVLALAPSAYLLPLAALAGLVLAIVLVIRRPRESAAT